MSGRVTPGAARIRKASDPRTWEVRKGYGFSGANTVFTGDDLKPFSVDILLWLPEHFDEWATFAKVLVKPTARTRSKAIGIYHPILRVPPLNISAVVVTDVSQFDTDDQGLWMCTIELLPFRAPKPALVKPAAAVPGVAKPVPTAQDAADVKMGQLMDQVNKLL
jgi:hypothetical protein